jgi:hypothetical protein
MGSCLACGRRDNPGFFGCARATRTPARMNSKGNPEREKVMKAANSGLSTSTILFVAVTAFLLSISGVRPALGATKQISFLSPSELKAYCDSVGGTYFSPSVNGVYGCLLPDGEVITCTAGTLNCTEGSDSSPTHRAMVLTLSVLGNIQATLQNLQTICTPPPSTTP